MLHKIIFFGFCMSHRNVYNFMLEHMCSVTAKPLLLKEANLSIEHNHLWIVCFCRKHLDHWPETTEASKNTKVDHPLSWHPRILKLHFKGRYSNFQKLGMNVLSKYPKIRSVPFLLKHLDLGNIRGRTEGPSAHSRWAVFKILSEKVSPKQWWIVFGLNSENPGFQALTYLDFFHPPGKEISIGWWCHNKYSLCLAAPG